MTGAESTAAARRRAFIQREPSVFRRRTRCVPRWFRRSFPCFTVSRRRSFRRPALLSTARAEKLRETRRRGRLTACLLPPCLHRAAIAWPGLQRTASPAARAPTVARGHGTAPAPRGPCGGPRAHGCAGAPPPRHPPPQKAPTHFPFVANNLLPYPFLRARRSFSQTPSAAPPSPGTPALLDPILFSPIPQPAAERTLPVQSLTPSLYSLGINASPFNVPAGSYPTIVRAPDSIELLSTRFNRQNRPLLHPRYRHKQLRLIGTHFSQSASSSRHT